MCPIKILSLANDLPIFCYVPAIPEGRRKALIETINLAVMSGRPHPIPRTFGALNLWVETYGTSSIIGRIECEQGKAIPMLSFAIHGGADRAEGPWVRLHGRASEPVETDSANPPGDQHWVAFTDHVPPTNLTWGPTLLEARKIVAELAYAWIHAMRSRKG